MGFKCDVEGLIINPSIETISCLLNNLGSLRGAIDYSDVLYIWPENTKHTHELVSNYIDYRDCFCLYRKIELGEILEPNLWDFIEDQDLDMEIANVILCDGVYLAIDLFNIIKERIPFVRFIFDYHNPVCYDLKRNAKINLLSKVNNKITINNNEIYKLLNSIKEELK